METGEHIRIFDLIAPIYAWFFGYQTRHFRQTISANASYINDASYKILDIGCGTGALASVLAEMGHRVTGLDGSPRMIALARRLNRGGTAQFMTGDALAADLSGQHYDLVVASHVLHGLQKEQRQKLYAVMRSLATKRVIIIDYNNRRSLLTSLVEWLEHGDYFNFIRSVEDEMRQNFPAVRTVSTGIRSAWYICECNLE